MKKILTIILTLTLTLLTTIPAKAALTFETIGNGLFGKPTSVEPVTIVGGYPGESDNINRSKDSMIIPPPFGSPTSYTLGSGELLTPGISAVVLNPDGYSILSGTEYVTAGSGALVLPPSIVETTTVSGGYANKFTLPDGLYYDDGSIGTLSIVKLSLSVKVYEEESLENLKKGVGHFKSTSCWDGNVGFAAHNRGLADYFGEIHTLKSGDKIVYTTKLGTRTYEVYFVGQINEIDYSRLGRTDENIVTLVTCVRDIPELRWCVQAREVVN
jgi:sortase A